MGGGGSMSLANASLKYNRSLIGKRKFKDTKALIINASGKTELEFRQVSPLELKKIKDSIRQEAKRKMRRLVIAYISIVVLFITLIAYWL